VVFVLAAAMVSVLILVARSSPFFKAARSSLSFLISVSFSAICFSFEICSVFKESIWAVIIAFSFFFFVLLRSIWALVISFLISPISLFNNLFVFSTAAISFSFWSTSLLIDL
jgi:hypothetical protein